jgi:dTDP-4-amino-4,6-dideoxygalactose transaminase
LPPQAHPLLCPFLDLKAEFGEIRTEVITAVCRVLESQQLILGEEVESLENEIRRLVGTRYAIACASGSDALLLALMALEIGPGDEVISTPFTFIATLGAVARLGARPVLVDIDPRTFNIDHNQIEAAVGPRTQGIIPVHLFGLASELDPIVGLARSRGLAVVEDAAQALGARYKEKPVGSAGITGCFSFFPSKNLGGAGDGGLLTTDDATLADRLRILRVHGGRRKYHYDVLGINSRLDALQAAILRAKLPHLDRWTQARRANAERYRALFNEFRLLDVVTLPTCPAHCHHVYNQFTIRVRQRDQLRESLRQRGIPTEVYYPVPLHLQPAFESLGYKQGQFPESEAASQEVLSLPICPHLKEEHQVAVVKGIAEFFDLHK